MPGVFRWKMCSKVETLVNTLRNISECSNEKCLKAPKKCRNETNDDRTDWEVFETGDDYLTCIYNKVLTLVTCSYEWSGARNIVLAVPVSGAVWSQKCS